MKKKGPGCAPTCELFSLLSLSSVSLWCCSLVKQMTPIALLLTVYATWRDSCHINRIGLLSESSIFDSWVLVAQHNVKISCRSLQYKSHSEKKIKYYTCTRVLHT